MATNWDHGYSLSSHTHSIAPDYRYTYGNINVSGLNNMLYATKETPMTTLEKIKQQRKEERERGAIEKMYKAYDKSSLANAYPGQIISFEWTPEGDDRVYRYAAICNNDKWWLTGRMSPSGVDYEDFVAWLIDHKIHVHDITFLARP